MDEQITLEEALELVTFYQGVDGTWRIKNVKSDVIGNVHGNVCGVKGSVGTVDGNVDTVKGSVLVGVGGSVKGTVEGNVTVVGGNVWTHVGGTVYGTINDCKWQFIETPKEKLQRLIKETGNQELLEAFNRVEDN